MNEATPEKSTSTPRTREPSPPLLLGSQQDISVQRKEDVGVRGEVSDPPIVVRDGRADHTAKGRAGGQRGQSTQAGGTNGLRQSVSSTLSALARKAAREKKHRFGSLYRLIDLQMLYESFGGLKRKAAPGVVFRGELYRGDFVRLSRVVFNFGRGIVGLCCGILC